MGLLPVVPTRVKLTVSWHAPQAAMLGTFFQLSPWGVAVEAVWQVVQLRMSWGYQMLLKATEPPKL